MLRDYQRRAADFIRDNKSCSAWLDMGLGKTLSTLTAIVESGVKPVLVIAPKKVAESVWAQEIKKWKMPLSCAVAVGNAKTRELAIKSGADIVVINRENTEWLYNQCAEGKADWVWDWVVLDESDSFKNAQSKRFKALRALKQQGAVSHFTCLTGTPASNGYENLWAPQFLIDGGLRLNKSQNAFYTMYYNKVQVSNYPPVFKFSLKQGAQDTIHRRLQDNAMSMKSEDYLELPDMIMNTLEVPLSAKEMESYKRFKNDAYWECADGEEITPVNAAALYSKLLQYTSGFMYKQGQDETNSREVEYINEHKIERLAELAEDGHNMLVFYNFKEDLRRLKERFPQARQLSKPQDIEDWNAGRIEIALAHPASAGHGLNLQDGGNIAVWFSPTWDLAQYMQANKRLHRSGQTKNVIIHHLVVPGTIDELLLHVLEGKGLTQDQLLEALKP